MIRRDLVVSVSACSSGGAMAAITRASLLTRAARCSSSSVVQTGTAAHVAADFREDLSAARCSPVVSRVAEVAAPVRAADASTDDSGVQQVEAGFDNIDHKLLMRTVKKHCGERWVRLYIERWLKAPLVREGTQEERARGTPQGGVVSPLLANLFLHYAMDRWIRAHLRDVQYCRYADDGVIHCQSEAQAEQVVDRLAQRLRQCGLELHPQKTRIVYCRDVRRTRQYANVTFTFLGYTFRPRKAVDKHGKGFLGFSAAVSREAMRNMCQRVRSWHLHLKSDKELSDLSNKFNPILRGWANYYGRFYPSALKPLWRHVNAYLVRWMQHKYKRLSRAVTRAARALGRLAERTPGAFVHWERGVWPHTIR